MHIRRNGNSVAICVYERFTTLCRLRLGLGLGLGHAWVTLGRRLGDPWVTQGSRLGRIEQMLCLQQKIEKAGWDSEIAEIARDLKDKTPPLINTRMTLIRKDHSRGRLCHMGIEVGAEVYANLGIHRRNGEN